jgi:hypothetical protein
LNHSLERSLRLVAVEGEVPAVGVDEVGLVIISPAAHTFVMVRRLF